MRICYRLAFVAVVLLPVPSGLAQTQSPGFFVTPIANAPFLAVVTDERNTRLPDGNWQQTRSIHAVARSTTGVIYNEARPQVPAGFAGEPPVITSHVYDPQTRLNTFIYPQSKTYRQRVTVRPPATETPNAFAAPGAAAVPANQFTHEEDLGNQTMEGVPVHGVRITQVIPSSKQDGQEVSVTDEYWYSSDLRVNMLVRHDDPRSGIDTVTVTQLSRTEPDEATFKIPAGYVDARAADASD